MTHYVTGDNSSNGFRSLREALEFALTASATWQATRIVRERKPNGRIVTAFYAGRPAA
jgi:hypothetical protein